MAQRGYLRNRERAKCDLRMCFSSAGRIRRGKQTREKRRNEEKTKKRIKEIRRKRKRLHTYLEENGRTAAEELKGGERGRRIVKPVKISVRLCAVIG